MFKRSAICLVVALVCLIGSATVFGQLPTATVLGTVKDQSGALLPGVTVTARNTDTNDTRKAVAGTDGSYRFDALPVGNYEIRADQSGFKTEVHGGLTLTVGQQQNLDFALLVGSSTEQVEVTTAAPTVDTTSGDLGGTVNEEGMSQLPLNGRDYMELAFLQAGTTQDMNRAASPASLGSQGTWFSANGAPVRANAFLMDGTYLNTYSAATGASIAGDTLGLDGIREFRIITNASDAEYGMYMGSQMAMVSASGNNTFHGDVFDYLRNSAMDARTYLDTPVAAGLTLAGAQRRLPPFRRNNFGGAIGGPIRKDKTFFFANYEGVQQLTGTSFLNTTIPSGCRGAAGATITPANCPLITSSQTVSAIVAPWIALFPLPNSGTSSLGWSFDEPDSENYGQLRLDQTFGSKDSAFVRYTGDADTIAQPGDFPGAPFNSTSQNHYVTVAETHVFSPYLLNTARASLSFTEQNITSPGYVIGGQYSFEPGLPMGKMTITGISPSYFGGNPASADKQYIASYSDDLFYTKGRHSLKVGTLINHYNLYVENGVNLWGTIAFSSYTNFLNANPSSNSQNAPGGIDYKQFVYDTIGGYVQDDYKLTPRLTLNLGLRYEMNSDINVVGPSRAFNGALENPTEDVNFTHTSWVTKNPSYLNIGPRLGFAYNVFGNGKTALRGGFGLLYQVAGWNAFLHGDAKAPFNQSAYTTTSGVITTLPIPVPTSTSLAALQLRNPYVYDWNIGQPKMTQYNLGIQEQLPWQSSLTVAYAGSRGYNLETNTDGNPVVPNGVPTLLSSGYYSCVAPAAGTSLPSINQQSLVYGAGANACNIPGVAAVRRNNNWGPYNETEDSNDSWYNALEVDYVKNVSHGLQIQTNLTYAKSEDDTQGATSGNNDVVGGEVYSSDPWNPMLDKGPSSFDTRWQWKTNLIYHTPTVGATNHILSGLVNGWWGTIISQVTSGFPFTVSESAFRSGMDVNGGAANAVTDRPDQNAGRNNKNITHGTSTGCQGLAAGTKLGTPTHWFDPCAYSIQSQGFLGNTHRNSLVGPNFRDVDFSLVKDTGARFLGETGKIEVRAEVFNVLNHPNFQVPTNNIVFAGTGAATGDVENPVSNAGQLTVVNPAREIQLALKFVF
jgi:hypothetical protein